MLLYTESIMDTLKKTNDIVLWEKWEAVLLNLVRKLGLANYPIDLLNIAIKYSLSVFKWNQEMYNLDVFKDITQCPKFENEFIVEYPKTIVNWFIVCFDRPIILSNHSKMAPISQPEYITHKTPEFIANNPRYNNKEPIKGPIICYTLIVHDLGHQETSYPLKFGLISVEKWNEKNKKEKERDTNARKYPWYRNGVSSILPHAQGHHIWNVKKGDYVTFEYEILKKFCHIYINGQLIPNAIQNIPNEFYPAIISVQQAKVEIVEGSVIPKK